MAEDRTSTVHVHKDDVTASPEQPTRPVDVNKNLDATESYDADLAFLQGLKGYDWTFRKPKCRWGKALKLQLWGTLVAVCLFIGLPALCLSLFVAPTSRFFITTDPTISYPGPSDDTVPIWVFFPIYVGIVLAIAINEMTYFRSVHINSTWAVWTILFFAIDLILAQIVTLSITEFVKKMVGRLRPDFLARCMLPANAALDQYNTDACTNPDEGVVEEGQKSYPSGHTSFAFCQGVYLAAYFTWSFYGRQRSKHMINKELHMNRFLREFQEAIRCTIIAVGPLGAWLIGATRIQDYKHNPSDVNAGAALGMLIAILTLMRGTNIYSRWTQQYVSNRPEKYQDAVLKSS